MPVIVYAFGNYQVDTGQKLLQRGADPVPLTPKAIETLLVLLKNHNRLVTKEELMAAVWPDTSVEEGSLTRNIYVLRKALAADPPGEASIETIPRRGYRFCGEVRVSELTSGKFPEETVVPNLTASPDGGKTAGSPWAKVAALAILAGAVTGIWAVAAAGSKPRPPVRFRPLTASATTLSIAGSALSLDGRYLAYSDATGTYLKNVDTAELSHLETPRGLRLDPKSWFPDGSKFLARAADPEASLWIVAATGTSPPRKIRDDVFRAAVSPDGRSIAFTNRTASELWLMRSDGSNPRRLGALAAPQYFEALSWYPDTNRLAVIKSRKEAGQLLSELETMDMAANHATPAWTGDGVIALAALRGGRTILSRLESLAAQTSNLWQIPVDLATGRARGNARQITDREGKAIYDLSAAADGRRLAFLEFTAAHNIEVAETDGVNLSGERRLTLDNRDDYPHAWTPDGRSVLFESNRNGNWDIFRQSLDQPFAEPVVATATSETQARISPDGAWVLFVCDRGQPAGLVLQRVRLAGGPVEDVMPMGQTAGYRCSGPSANLCVVAEWRDRTLEFTAFDAVRGRGRLVSQTAATPATLSDWDLSRDGKSIVLALHGEGPARVRVLPANAGAAHDFEFREWPYLRTVNWRADGSGWIGATRSGDEVALLSLDRTGASHALWKATTSFFPWAIPAPDGKHLAFPVYTSHFEAWMMENF